LVDGDALLGLDFDELYESDRGLPDCTLRGEPFRFLDPPLESGMAIGKAEVLTRFGVVMLTTPALAISITGLPVDIANGRPRRPPQLRLPLSINITSPNLTRTEAQKSSQNQNSTLRDMRSQHKKAR